MTGQRKLVTRIATHRRASHRRTLWLDDEPWRDVASEALRMLGIAVGDTVDPAALDEVLQREEPRIARERALRLLLYRDRSVEEMRTRLGDDGFEPAIVGILVCDLKSSGLLNDARFAEGFARVLVASRGYGRERALREFRTRGIADDLARDALDAVAPPDGEPERALTLARRLLRVGDTTERLAARLVRRGFSPPIALRAARTLCVASDADEVAADDI